MSTIRSNLPKIYAFKFLMGLHFFGGVLIPFFTDWGGINYFRVMVLQSFFVFSVFLLEVPTGHKLVQLWYVIDWRAMRTRMK